MRALLPNVEEIKGHKKKTKWLGGCLLEITCILVHKCAF